MERKSIVGMPTVEEFSNIFIDDLPKLAPVWDVEFMIDLELGEVSVHKATYKMALAKLKELKPQLQELVD